MDLVWDCLRLVVMHLVAICLGGRKWVDLEKSADVQRRIGTKCVTINLFKLHPVAVRVKCCYCAQLLIATIALLCRSCCRA